jgi:hypothetical protein
LNRSRRPTLDPGLIAVLRSAGEDMFDALLVDASRSDRPLKVREERRLPAAAVSAWIERNEAGTRLLLLPSAATICRLYRLEGVSREQAEQALRLQAESHLLGGVPPHRIAMALLPPGGAASDGGLEHAGVLLAWPEQAEIAMPPGGGWRVVPEIAALLAVPGASIASEPICWADPSDGSVAVVMPTPAGGVLPRATCEIPLESESWEHALRRAIADTAMAAGWPAASTAQFARGAAAASGATEPELSLPPSLASNLESAVEELPATAVGRLLAATAIAASGPLRALSRILPSGELQEQSPIERAIARALARLAEPRVAAVAIAAAVLLAALVPVVSAGVRLSILRWKLPDPLAFESSMRDSERRLAVYRELQGQAWPVAKLLGDLSNCLPESVELQSVMIQHGEPITIRGLAKPEAGRSGIDAIIELEQRLRQTQVFDKITKRWDEPDARGVLNFSLSTHVTRPTHQPRFESSADYAVTSFAERRYGPAARAVASASREVAAPRRDTPQASVPAPAAPALPPASAPAPAPSAMPGAEATASTGEGDGGAPPAVVAMGEENGAAGEPSSPLPQRGIGRRRGESAASREVEVPAPAAEGLPPALSDLEIGAMSRAEARTALERVARARQMPGLDDEAKARLKSDFDRLMQRVREAP